MHGDKLATKTHIYCNNRKIRRGVVYVYCFNKQKKHRFIHICIYS